MEIRNCIAELLSEHDCVIIPGFGGFIGNYAPARIDPVHHTFHPPSKQLLFNVNLRHNDGLLAARVSLETGSSYAEASKLTEDFAEVCMSAINAGEVLQFPKIGRLFAGKEANIQFEQHKTVNLLPDSYGLSTFISPPIADFKTRKPVMRKQVGKHPAGRERHFVHGLLKWAAIMSLPVGITVVIGVMQYDKIASKYISNAGVLNSVFTRFSPASLFEKKSAPSVKYTIPAGNVVKPVPNQASSEIPAALPEISATSTNVSVGTESSGTRFAVIIGAFRMKENAEKLIGELKTQGVEASVFDCSKTGLYRVSIGTSSQKEEALQLLSYAQTTGFDGAWLLAK